VLYTVLCDGPHSWECSAVLDLGVPPVLVLWFNSIYFIHGSLYMIWDKSKINT
jgi:hypothetical protein